MHICKTETVNRQTSFHLKAAEDKWVLWPLCRKSGNSVLMMFHKHCYLDLIPEDLWALRSWGGDRWPLQSQSMHDTRTGARSSGPSLLFRRPHLISEAAGCCCPGWGVLCYRWTIWAHLILSLPHRLQILFSPHWQSKISTAKNAQESIYWSSQMGRMALKDTNAIIAKEFFQLLSCI